MTVAKDAVSIGTEAMSVIERMRAVAGCRPLDRSRMEAALGAHVRAFGLSARPVHWVDAPGEGLDPQAHARDGFLAAWIALDVGHPGQTWRKSPCFDLLHGAFRTPGMLKEAEQEEKSAGRGTRRAAQKAAEAIEAALGFAVGAVSLHANAAVSDAAHAKGLFELAGIADARSPGQRAAGDVKSEVDFASAARSAAAAAGWLARAQVLESAQAPATAVRKLAEVYLPLLDALEAGLWLYWVTPDAVLAVPAPASLRATARIERPRERVWAAFTDVASWAVWGRFMPGGPLQRVEPDWSEGAVADFGSGLQAAVSACVPGESVTLIGGMVTAPRTWIFSDTADGATLLAYEAFEEFAPVPEAMVKNIKEYVESQL